MREQKSRGGQVLARGALKGPQFPSVRGSSLSGKAFQLPSEIEGEWALLMIAFQQWQQGEVDTWIPIARGLAERHPNLAFYELPTIRRLPGFARNFIDGGMRAGIADRIARDTTITLYLNKEAFRRALDIPSEETITVMLIDRQGNIHWRSTGPATPEMEHSLRETIEAASVVQS